MSSATPLVSVICLCYNQANFVRQAVASVLNQSYPNIELIIADDGSSDKSKEVIRSLVAENPSITFVDLPQNLGNCKAFNRALAYARGSYLIDLAADDVLLNNRVEVGVRVLQQSGPDFGVHFSDAEIISDEGDTLYTHSKLYPHHTIPQGDIYLHLISRYFICPPSMMFTREVMNHLGGYDENLLYEDFDFWIRSSRVFKYCYTPEVLVKKRVVKNSLSAKQIKKLNPQLKSTFRVCKKVFRLNQTREEKQALSGRLLYEMRVCIRLFDFGTAMQYCGLWLRNKFT